MTLGFFFLIVAYLGIFLLLAFAGSLEGHIDRIAYEGQWLRSVSETPSLLFPLVPAVLAGLFGFGMLEVAYADADVNEVCVDFSFKGTLILLVLAFWVRRHPLFLSSLCSR